MSRVFRFDEFTKIEQVWSQSGDEDQDNIKLRKGIVTKKSTHTESGKTYFMKSLQDFADRPHGITDFACSALFARLLPDQTVIYHVTGHYVCSEVIPECRPVDLRYCGGYSSIVAVSVLMGDKDFSISYSTNLFYSALPKSESGDLKKIIKIDHGQAGNRINCLVNEFRSAISGVRFDWSEFYTKLQECASITTEEVTSQFNNQSAIIAGRFKDVFSSCIANVSYNLGKFKQYLKNLDSLASDKFGGNAVDALKTLGPCAGSNNNSKWYDIFLECPSLNKYKIDFAGLQYEYANYYQPISQCISFIDTGISEPEALGMFAGFVKEV